MFTILIDIIPSKYRKIVYALVALLSLGFSIWQATDGNWGQFIIGLIASLTTTTASVNTLTTDLYAPGSIVNPDDGLSYAEAGGLPMPQPGADEDGFGGDAPEPAGGHPPVSGN